MPVDEIKRSFSINLKNILENDKDQYNIVKDLNYRRGTVLNVYNLGGNFVWNM